MQRQSLKAMRTAVLLLEKKSASGKTFSIPLMQITFVDCKNPHKKCLVAKKVTKTISIFVYFYHLARLILGIKTTLFK